MKKLSFSLAGIATALIGPAIAQAQNADIALEEIVVTAERVSSDIQKTPVAVAVLSGEDLEKRNITSVNNLQFATPGLTIQQSNAINIINIRGVGLSATGPNFGNGVAQYWNGLYTTSTGNTNNYFDVAQVEVLRGPQGTLSGQNATGGAIYLSSKRPQFNSDEGYASLQLGNYNNVRVEGAKNLAISDAWAARISVAQETRKSFYANLNANSFNPLVSPGSVFTQPGNINNQQLRVGLSFKPNDFWDGTLIQEYANTRSDGITNQIVGTATPGTTNYLSSVAIYNATPRGTRELSYNDQATRLDNRTYRGSLQLNFHLNDNLDLRSISGQQYTKQDERDDSDASPFDNGYGTFDTSQRATSQEFNLVYSGPQRLNGVIGALYYRLHGYQYAFTETHGSTATGVWVDTVPDTYTFVKFDTYQYVTAAFAQATFKIIPELELLGGARYTFRDDKLQRGFRIGTVPITNQNPAQTRADGDASATPTTYKLGLNWYISDKQFAYAQYATGFKDGTFQTSVDFGNVVKPEWVYNSEVGWKATLLDGRIRTNVDVYYTDYKDFQIQIPAQVATPPITPGSGPGDGGTFNSQGAKIKGIEAAFQAQLFDGLGLSANAAYSKSEFRPLTIRDNTLVPGPAAFIDIGGHTLNFAPKWTANVAVDYAFRFAGGGTLTPRAELSYQAEQYSRVFDQAYDLIPSRSILDLRLGYRPNDAWQVDGYVTNANDKLYYINRTQTTVAYGSPRQFGVKATYRF
ncbi:MAG: TonB-dependent receptor [Steroidobacteraceae bacterium]